MSPRGGCGGFPSQSLCVTCGNFCQRLGRFLRCCVVALGVGKVVRVGTSTHWLSFVCFLGWWGSEEDAWLLWGLPGVSQQLAHTVPLCKGGRGTIPASERSPAPGHRAWRGEHRQCGDWPGILSRARPAQSYVTVPLQRGLCNRRLFASHGPR